ncbi:MAG: hypothetical protein HIU83_00975 [Proteobacteria bacterium]|nr:hypothetical protein [Pseudomonadota bacterium]
MQKNEQYKRLEQERPEAIKAGITYGGQVVPLVDMGDLSALSILNRGSWWEQETLRNKSVVMAGGAA